jgi:hypothetical protein
MQTLPGTGLVDTERQRTEQIGCISSKHHTAYESPAEESSNKGSYPECEVSMANFQLEFQLILLQAHPNLVGLLVQGMAG